MSPTENVGAKAAPQVEYTPKLASRAPTLGARRNGEIRVVKVDSPLPASTVLRLEAGEAELLRDLAADLASSPSENPELFCEEAGLLAAHLPRRVRRHLAEFARRGTREGFLVVRGLPLDPELLPTPPDNSSHLGETTLTAAAQAIVNQCLGEMIAYEAEGGGRLFQDLVPSRHAAKSQTSLSSDAELEVHTEQAFSPLRPDWVSLSSLRGARDAATFMLSARILVAAVEPAERELLRQPLWTSRVDESFLEGGREFHSGELRGPFPIVEGSDEDPFIRFDQDLFWGVSREAEELRRRVIDLYPQLRTSHTLAPGELLLIDNHRVIHGRSPFKVRFDGSDRFVVRSFVVHDLARSRDARFGNGRMIGACFS
jgi:L-asparagine oxygenase